MKVISSDNKIVKHWTEGVLFEEEAKKQVMKLLSLPCIGPHIAIMPDVHAGIGATVGSVIPTVKAVIPAAVGVDIGCGMAAIKLPLTADDLPNNLKELRYKLEAVIPHGRTNNGQNGDRGAWGDLPELVKFFWDSTFLKSYKELVKKHPKIEHKYAPNHLGTLGTGNHFVEMCLDETNNVWLMLHSGSRGIGNSIGRYFIELAKEDMERYFINLPDKNLAYLPQGTEHFADYMKAVTWAQDFARVNREVMIAQALGVIKGFFPHKNVNSNVSAYSMVVNCHHNYISVENHFGENMYITRKGAVRARKSDYAIIPGSMGAKSYIVRGKGNEDSFTSCSHGAGRKMSRTQAKKTFSVEDHVEATKGVECRKDADVVDETPMAYKDIDQVMEAQKDLVEVVHTLKQVLCIKG